MISLHGMLMQQMLMHRTMLVDALVQGNSTHQGLIGISAQRWVLELLTDLHSCIAPTAAAATICCYRL